MKVGDLVRYQWHGDGPRPIKNSKKAGIVISTAGIMICAFGLAPGEEPYEMGTVQIMWKTDDIERVTFAALEVINEC